MPTNEQVRADAILAAIGDFADAVMESTKHQGTSPGANKRERVAARRLWRLLFGVWPTDETLERMIPG